MEKKYLNTKQLAEYIGRSPKAIRDMVFRRDIPFRKPGGRLLFAKNEIDNWIESSDGISLSELDLKTKNSA